MPINWTADLNTGIDVIDKQHMRIVDLVNKIEVAKQSGNKELISQVVEECVDYTQSHFAFEESLQAEAGYPFIKPHKKVHSLFTRRVSEYQQRIALGDEVADELHQLLCRWLVHHIKHDDADYVESVKNFLKVDKPPVQEHKETGWFKRLFG